MGAVWAFSVNAPHGNDNSRDKIKESVSYTGAHKPTWSGPQQMGLQRLVFMAVALLTFSIWERELLSFFGLFILCIFFFFGGFLWVFFLVVFFSFFFVFLKPHPG